MGSRRKILLVDDDTSLLVTLGDFFRFEGYEVVTASTGEQALERLQSYTPDLIILDMSMPGMGGIGFLRRISTSDGKPTYPVLVLTARANMAEFFANVEVDGFVAKPCSPEDLLMEVGRIVFLRRSGETDSKARARRRLLLGDDDETSSRRLATDLAAEGYVVECVSRGPDIVEKAMTQQPDAIVVRSGLGGMDGAGLVRLLQDVPSARGIPVVLFGGGDMGGGSKRGRNGLNDAAAVVAGSDAIAVVSALRDVLGG
jgi:CheY-like chemotaxis protein